MDILVTCSDRTRWALGPFSYLFNKYWSALTHVTVLGYAPPLKPLPDNFEFVSLGEQSEFPSKRWSDALIVALGRVKHRFCTILLEDYWLTRKVDTEAVEHLLRYMHDQPDVVRMDLTTDRLYANRLKDIGPLYRMDLIESDPNTEYHISLQAGIWNVSLLQQLLEPGWSPWDFEIAGSDKVRKTKMRVLGTRQAPVRYLIAIRAGKFSLDGSWQYPPKQLERVDVEELTQLGLLEVPVDH